MSAWNIAIVGATGQVGTALIELLQQSSVEVENLYLLGSDNSEGEVIRYNGKNLTVLESAKMDFSQCHFAFFVANQTVSEKYAPIAAESGCIVIDTSGYFINQEHIPLLVPKINNSVLTEYRNDNIIALASAPVCQLLLSVASLTDTEQLTNLHLTNFLPASLYGKPGVDELAGQSARLLNGVAIGNSFFSHQLAFNILPVSHQNEDLLLSEKSQIDQIRKVLSNYQLPVSIESVIMPVFYGMSQAVNVSSSFPIEIDSARFNEFGVELLNNNLPTPVTEANPDNNDNLAIKVANLRHGYGNFEQIQFWSVADNVRYLGAKLLIETLEILINDYV